MVAEVLARVAPPDFAASLVARVNEYLAAEAARPAEEVAPLRAGVAEFERRRGRLIRLCEESDEPVADVAARLKDVEAQLAELRLRVRNAEGGGTGTLRPVTAAEVAAALADLPALLKEDVARAAPLLRERTGPVVVEQGEMTGKRGATWVARFQANAVPVLAVLARRRGCPSAGSREYLSTRGWKSPTPAKARMDYEPKYLAHAERAAGLRAAGMTLPQIADELGENYSLARTALRYALYGECPKARPVGDALPIPRHVQMSGEVARLVGEGLSLPAIALRLRMTVPTAARAYAHAREAGEALVAAPASGRGRHERLPASEREAKQREVCERFDRGESAPTSRGPSGTRSRRSTAYAASGRSSRSP